MHARLAIYQLSHIPDSKMILLLEASTAMVLTSPHRAMLRGPWVSGALFLPQVYMVSGQIHCLCSTHQGPFLLLPVHWSYSELPDSAQGFLAIHPTPYTGPTFPISLNSSVFYLHPYMGKSRFFMFSMKE